MEEPIGTNLIFITWPWQTRRWTVIKEALKRRPTSHLDIDSIVNAVRPRRLTAAIVSGSLDTYHHEFPGAYDRDLVTNIIFPKICNAVLDGQKLFGIQRIPLLMVNDEVNITFTRAQVRTIVACAFFGLLDNRIPKPADDAADMMEYLAEMDMAAMFKSGGSLALHCIFTYFLAFTDESNHDEITVVRRGAKSIPAPNWESAEPIGEIRFAIGSRAHDKVSIQSTSGIIGDSFLSIYDEEAEILLSYPELWTAALICPKLAPTEVAIVVGVRRYNVIDPVSRRWINDNIKDASHHSGCDNMTRAIIYADVSPKNQKRSQYSTFFINDLNKLYIAMSCLSVPALSMSRWANRAAGINPHLRCLQAILAASASKKILTIYCYNDEEHDSCVDFYNRVRDGTVGDLFYQYSETIREAEDIERLILFDEI